MNDLPKWPQLVVTGVSVSPDRASEIIIRTSNFHFFSNDLEFENRLHAVIDRTFDWSFNSGHRLLDNRARVQSVQEYFSDFLLDLDYLANDRIVSAWIGGSHGWIDWDGTVGCCNYNIGKWPSVTGVELEWEAIAAAFGDLDLCCQLMSGEAGEDNQPVVEYRIKDGGVKLITNPTARLLSNVEYLNPIEQRLNMGEQGCTIEQFEAALQLCVEKHNSR